MAIKFAFIVPPLAGHVNPTLGLGGELLQRGHRVGWISLDSSLVLPEGGELLLISGEEHRDAISQKNVYGIESIRFLYDEVLIPLNRYMYGGIIEWMESWKPDVVINDHQLFAGAIAAYQRSVPYATSVTAPAAVKMMEDLPGVHEWEVQRMVGLQKELGLDGERCVACSEQMALLFTSREFFGDMELPSSYQFVGPVIRRPVGGDAFDWERFNRMSERYRIMVSIGTTFDHGQQMEFLQKVVAAFGGEDVLVVLVSDVGLLASWPENFLVQRRVPQLELLPHLDAVVCHGGHNTVCESLTHGLPLVVLPIAYDQSHVASRVVAADSGLRLNFKRSKPEELRGAVWEVLRENKYRDAAVRVGQSFRDAGGVERAADLLEKLK